MATFHKRKFVPINKEKYEGNWANIISRSSWETKFMIWCDTNPAIIKWQSEELCIPYLCATDGRPHRYFPDFRIKVKAKDGSIKVYIVEIKPAGQTQPPKYPGKQTKRYITESMTYLKNRSKWEAAENYCKARNMEFMILTEQHLF